MSVERGMRKPSFEITSRQRVSGSTIALVDPERRLLIFRARPVERIEVIRFRISTIRLLRFTSS